MDAQGHAIVKRALGGRLEAVDARDRLSTIRFGSTDSGPSPRAGLEEAEPGGGRPGLGRRDAAVLIQYGLTRQWVRQAVV